MEFEPLTQEEADEFLAEIRARTENDRQKKREARMRIAARDESRRADSAVSRELETMTRARDTAVARVEMYEFVMEEVVRRLGNDRSDLRALMRGAIKSTPASPAPGESWYDADP